MIVGAGDGPCLVLAIGARERSVDNPDWGGYPVDETARRHGRKCRGGDDRAGRGLCRPSGASRPRTRGLAAEAMTFAVAAEAYNRFMGRTGWARASAGRAGRRPPGARARRRLRPGALTTERVALLGPAEVAAVDPSESFVAAARERHPGVTVEQAAAEALPFADDEFDAALASSSSTS